MISPYWIISHYIFKISKHTQCNIDLLEALGINKLKVFRNNMEYLDHNISITGSRLNITPFRSRVQTILNNLHLV